MWWKEPERVRRTSLQVHSRYGLPFYPIHALPFILNRTYEIKALSCSPTSTSSLNVIAAKPASVVRRDKAPQHEWQQHALQHTSISPAGRRVFPAYRPIIPNLNGSGGSTPSSSLSLRSRSLRLCSVLPGTGPSWPKGPMTGNEPRSTQALWPQWNVPSTCVVFSTPPHIQIPELPFLQLATLSQRIRMTDQEGKVS